MSEEDKDKVLTVGKPILKDLAFLSHVGDLISGDNIGGQYWGTQV